MNARATAVRRSTRVGLRFEPVGHDWRIGEYADGNGNGIRATDIASGVDLEVAQAEFISSLFPGVGFGLHSGVPDVDGSRSTGADGLRVGPSGILTLGPDGTATSGTLYVRGQRGQYAIRTLGITGRTRVLRFHPGTDQWRRTDRTTGRTAPASGSARDAAGHASPGMSGRCRRPELASIQVQSARPLRPDSLVLARVVVGEQSVTIRAVVLRCSVWAVDPEALTYRAGLRFEELCPPIWEELARRAHLLHAPL